MNKSINILLIQVKTLHECINTVQHISYWSSILPLLEMEYIGGYAPYHKLGQ